MAAMPPNKIMDSIDAAPSPDAPTIANPAACSRPLPQVETRSRKRRELSNLLERFYFADDGTAGLHESVREGFDECNVSLEEMERGLDQLERRVHHMQQQQSCPQHTKVRLRNGRCPLCAAHNTRELKRRNSISSTSNESVCSGESFRRRSSMGSLGVCSAASDSDGGMGGFGDFQGRGQQQPSSSAASEPPSHNFNNPQPRASPKQKERHSFSDQSTDELLDPKWAGALKQISASLASCASLGERPLSKSLKAVSSESCTPDSNCRPLSKSLNGGDSIVSDIQQLKEELESTFTELVAPLDSDKLLINQRSRSEPINPITEHNSLSQLRQMIAMAHDSLGRFTPNDDFDNLSFYNPDECTYNDQYDNSHSCQGDWDDVSISSMAREGKKNFAEKKGRIFPVRQQQVERGVGRLCKSKSLPKIGAGVNEVVSGDGAANSSGNTVSKSFTNPSCQDQPNHPQGTTSNNSNSNQSHHSQTTSSHTSQPNDSSLIQSYSSSSLSLPGACDTSKSSTDSSVSLSVSSKDSCGSPGNSVQDTPCCEDVNEEGHNRSPTSTLEDISVESCAEGEESVPFGPPYGNSSSDGACSNATQSESESSNQQVVVEDVESDDGDLATVACEDSPASGRHTYSSRPQALPVYEACDEDDDDLATVAFQDLAPASGSQSYSSRAPQASPLYEGCIEDNDDSATVAYQDLAPSTPCPDTHQATSYTAQAQSSSPSRRRFDEDDDLATVAFDDLAPSTTGKQTLRRSRTPSRGQSQSSFISALVQNARARSRSKSRGRSRSKSRGRARSQSRGRSVADVEAEGEVQQEACTDEVPHVECDVQDEIPDPGPSVAEMVEDVIQSTNSLKGDDMKIIHQEDVVSTSDLLIPPREETELPKPNPQFSRSSPKHHFPPPPTGIRGPIFHPDYQLGDVAREEDMIIFSSYKSRKGRNRRSRKHHGEDEDLDTHQSDAKAKAVILQAIGQLIHLDAAFVRRSDGTWTYAIVADGCENSIRFVVNDRGSTKSYPKKLWASSIRRIRVLTRRHGDRFPVKDGSNIAPGRRRRSTIGKGKGRSKGRGRLTSPSPTRRNAGVLNIPTTIPEEAWHKDKRKRHSSRHKRHSQH